MNPLFTHNAHTQLLPQTGSYIETWSFEILGYCTAGSRIFWALAVCSAAAGRHWSWVNSRKTTVIASGWRLILCGLLQSSQCWFAIPPLFPLRAPFLSPLPAVLLESLEILMFLQLVNKRLMDEGFVRTLQRWFNFPRVLFYPAWTDIGDLKVTRFSNLFWSSFRINIQFPYPVSLQDLPKMNLKSPSRAPQFGLATATPFKFQSGFERSWRSPHQKSWWKSS